MKNVYDEKFTNINFTKYIYQQNVKVYENIKNFILDTKTCLSDKIVDDIEHISKRLAKHEFMTDPEYGTAIKKFYEDLLNERISSSIFDNNAFEIQAEKNISRFNSFLTDDTLNFFIDTANNNVCNLKYFSKVDSEYYTFVFHYGILLMPFMKKNIFEKYIDLCYNIFHKLNYAVSQQYKNNDNKTPIANKIIKNKFIEKINNFNHYSSELIYNVNILLNCYDNVSYETYLKIIKIAYYTNYNNLKYLIIKIMQKVDADYGEYDDFLTILSNNVKNKSFYKTLENSYIFTNLSNELKNISIVNYYVDKPETKDISIITKKDIEDCCNDYCKKFNNLLMFIINIKDSDNINNYINNINDDIINISYIYGLKFELEERPHSSLCFKRFIDFKIRGLTLQIVDDEIGNTIIDFFKENFKKNIKIYIDFLKLLKNAKLELQKLYRKILKNSDVLHEYVKVDHPLFSDMLQYMLN